jgi:hypothetical protein
LGGIVELPFLHIQRDAGVFQEKELGDEHELELGPEEIRNAY